MEINQRLFATSRGFTYSYYRGEPNNTVFEISDSQTLPIKYFREQGFIVIAPDLLGLGGTSKPLDPEAYRASLICQDLIELLDAENILNGQIIAVGHDQGSRILSRLANLYPDRCRAYAFLADPYYPPRPMTNLDFSIFASKKIAGYELRGYSLFFAEDGADKLIESRLDSFLSIMFPKDPKLWATELAPVGALKSWLQRDSRAILAPYIDTEDMEEWRNVITKEGIGAALCYHKAYVTGLNADDDKGIPLEKYNIEKPVFFAAAHHDYVSRDLLGIAQTQHNCKNTTVREFQAGHWLMMATASEINAALFSWIMDCI